ncbi:conserved hypothetical protein [Shewanella denitrificans OS217]|jgi:hypothetical protein|uniref:DUF2780 domain-containing protein n=1 Tax=Shewanella denitrificans (strain OS217 / ATCC BAA-1090 / DSM 15013) TaxID=318161 RepID=Q12IF3_SHEDO|nr:DUF2780 domain-containing protein [Shewanella denitrificans]ABE56773.1 conserved hypothetical protein [Shewanella denitrificans OS217]
MNMLTNTLSPNIKLASLTLGILLSLSASIQAASLTDLIPKATVSPAQIETVNALGQMASTPEAQGLLSNVMSQLNLNQAQAQGGLGSLLTLAKSQLGQQDFASISQQIPNMDTLLAAAPNLSKSSGMSGLLSKVGGNLGNSLQGGAMVYDSFEKLGIPKDMIVPMVEIAKTYLQSQDGGATADLLMQGLNAL